MPSTVQSPDTARREWTDGVTFREFRRLATTQGWTVEQLTERVGGGSFGARGPAPTTRRRALISSASCVVGIRSTTTW
jgi:hypothetical protein